MKTDGMKVVAFLAMIGLLALGSSLWADPPNRVGRLNLVSGTVSFHPASLEEWTPATLNYPLTTGDHLWTDQDGEAEIHVGSMAIRLASSTDFEFINLDDQTAQIRLSTGSLNLRLRHLDPDEVVEIDTPNSSLTLTRPGSYRIDVQETGDTSLTVTQGEAEVTAGNATFSVFPRQVADISGIDSPEYQIDTAAPPDDWDAWCQERDRVDDRPAPYVSQEMIGAEDLGEYGTWHLVTGYGPVWRPREVVVGWTPYHYGHWAWVDPWGWTWIDDAPWGFAPFHYGRWAYLDGGWAWVPGPVATRPVYAPALVAFVGGNGWGATVVAGGGVGWFPLGPREPYVPPYTVSNTYIRNVNYGHVTVVNVQQINVTRITYVNRGVPGAVTVVPNQAFVRAQPVAGASFVVPPDEIRRAPVRGWTAPVAPVRESVLAQPFMPRGPVAQPPAAVMSRPVVGRMAPPPPPVPFAAREQALQARPGRPLDQQELTRLRGASPPPSRPPMVIVNPAGRYQGPAAPGAPAPRRVPGAQGPGPQPVGPQGQQGPRPVAPGTQTPRMQPGTPQQAPGPQPGIQQKQPAPRMQPGNRQPGTPPGQQGQPPQRLQPGTPPGQQPGVQQGQPAPRMQPGVRRGQQGQPVPAGPKPEVKQPGGPRGQQGGQPSQNNDQLKKKQLGDQGQQRGPGGGN